MTSGTEVHSLNMRNVHPVHWDSNQQPLDYEPPPITNGSGLPTKKSNNCLSLNVKHWKKRVSTSQWIIIFLKLTKLLSSFEIKSCFKRAIFLFIFVLFKLYVIEKL